MRDFAKVVVDDIFGITQWLLKGLARYLCYTFEEKYKTPRTGLYRDLDFDGSEFIIKNGHLWITMNMGVFQRWQSWRTSN